jgi:uncharacterized protein YkwD
MLPTFRLNGWLVATLVILVLIAGVLPFSVLAAQTNTDTAIGENGDNGLYLPLVIQPAPTTTPPIMDIEEQVVALTNLERLAHGCGPVTMDSRLRAAAEGHSEDMALNNYFDHYAPDGTSPWDRIRDQGYFYSMAGENIAAGYSSPESVVAGWMNSEGHRANILNCGYIHIGVGYYYLANDTGEVNYQHYWTQVLASPFP